MRNYEVAAAMGIVAGVSYAAGKYANSGKPQEVKIEKLNKEIDNLKETRTSLNSDVDKTRSTLRKLTRLQNMVDVAEKCKSDKSEAEKELAAVQSHLDIVKVEYEALQEKMKTTSNLMDPEYEKRLLRTITDLQQKVDVLERCLDVATAAKKGE